MIELYVAAAFVLLIAGGVVWLALVEARKYTCPKCGYQGRTNDRDQPEGFY